MRYPVNVPGMEGRVEIETSSLTAGSRLLVDGRPASKGPGKGDYVVARPGGRQSVVQLAGQRLDMIPKVTVDGVPQEIAPPLKPAEWVVAAAPIFLMFVGGGIGGVCAAMGVISNLTLFRSGLPLWAKYLSAIGVTLACVAVYVVIASALYRHWHPGMSPSPAPGVPQPMTPPGMPAPPSMPAPPPMPGFPGHP